MKGEKAMEVKQDAVNLYVVYPHLRKFLDGVIGVCTHALEQMDRVKELILITTCPDCERTDGEHEEGCSGWPLDIEQGIMLKERNEALKKRVKELEEMLGGKQLFRKS